MAVKVTGEKVPHIPLEVLEYLERTYPDRAPDPTTPERIIWTDVGHVEVCRHLRQLFNRQKE